MIEQQRYFYALEHASVSEMNAADLASLFDEAACFYCRCIGLYSVTSSLVTRQFERELEYAALSVKEQLTLLRTPIPDLMEIEQAEWVALVAARRFSPELALAHARKYPFITLNLGSGEAVADVLRGLFE